MFTEPRTDDGESLVTRRIVGSVLLAEIGARLRHIDNHIATLVEYQHKDHRAA